jgi:hypothetical protein
MKTSNITGNKAERAIHIVASTLNAIRRQLLGSRRFLQQ